ncbi:hypothetical protein GCM10017786_54240 [Amycolatopsis deserti]|uniref:Uncharacterized protein n=1 Tax=Amycolatopsis deserti TaxID=185696 RepID=A0ABQ3JAY2_9PSEU|nr:hypothetical protein [Amycolatopsis deserti]GHF13720.1 hypothetical protein GCM10017786_54240 [Amycolatopsis deserti]
MAGAIGGLGYGKGVYSAALVTGAVLTPVPCVTRARGRVLPTALATAVLVVIGLLPLWIR